MANSPLNSVLVVEDDPAWRDILTEILTDIGLLVDSAGSLEASLRELHAAPHRLAVVDLSLGGIDHHNQDGLLVLDAIRLHDPGCVALLLTGFANVELAVSAISEHGAFTCLRKENFDRREFREVLRRALTSKPPRMAGEADGPGLPQGNAILTGCAAISGGEDSDLPELGAPESDMTESDAFVEETLSESCGDSALQKIHRPVQGAIALLSGFALVVEDSAAWRSALSELLVEAGLQVHPCSSYAEALGRLRRGKYTLAVIDLSLAGAFPSSAAFYDAGLDGQKMDGFRLLASTRAGGMPTIVVSGLNDPDEIERAYAEHDIYAYLPKQVFNRKVFLDTVHELMQKLEKQKAGSDLPDALTDREREVLDLLAEGLTNKEIAEALVISTNTVKRHLKAIFEKLDVHTRSAATARVVGGSSEER